MSVRILGDTHLGRKFTKGIPLERRGEREQLVREDFVRQLDPAGAATHIHMGDIFDKPQVAYEDLAFAATAYTTAAGQHPGTTFYILQGNHDDSRDLGEVTAWDIFCRLMVSVPNVVCVTEPLAIAGVGLLLPWHPSRTALHQFDIAAETAGYLGNVGIDTAYGHWDVDLRTAGHNVIPTAELAALGIIQAFTGHVHKPDRFTRDGVDVTVVGSMQPYAQGECGGQSDHIRYVTLSLEEALSYPPGVLEQTCVRLQLQPGETWDLPIPACLSWDVQRMRPEAEHAPADVSMEGFDISLAFQKAIDAHDIIPTVREKIDTRWSEIMSREG